MAERSFAVAANDEEFMIVKNNNDCVLGYEWREIPLLLRTQQTVRTS